MSFSLSLSSKTTQWVVTLTACSLVFFGQSAVDFFLPSLPAMVRDLQSTPTYLQMSVTFYVLAFSLSQPLFAPFSERFGRRPLLLLGTLLFAFASVGAALAPTVAFFLTARVIQGLGMGSGSVLQRALVRDLFADVELARRMSYLSMTWGVAPLIAPVIGGYIGTYLGWRATFWFMVALIGVAFLLYFFFVPETKDSQKRHSLHLGQLLGFYREVLVNRAFQLHTLILICCCGSLYAYATASPWLLQKFYGLSPVAYGWSMVIVGGGYVFGAYLNSHLVRRWGVSRTLRYASLCGLFFGTVLLVIAFFPPTTPWLLIFPVLGIEFSVAHLFPNAVGAAMHPFHHHPASASAFLGLLTYLGGTFSSLLIAYLPDNSQLPLAGMLFAFLGVAALTTHLLLPRK